MPAEPLVCPWCEQSATEADAACPACGRPPWLQAPSGTRWILRAKLGSGSFGVTWRAQEAGDPARVVAIKAVRLEALNEDGRKLLDREVGVLATLSHPDVPALHEAFDTRGAGEARRWLVQTFLPGPTLRQEMSAVRYALPEVLAILGGVLEILVYLHDLHPPVIHRDLKPENLIHRTDTGRWALIDFGSVRDCFSGTLGGQTITGTHWYMAPEQFMGDATPGTDLWAVGVLGVELLSRRPLKELRKDQWTFAWDPAVQAPAEVKAWLGKLLAPEPERRAQSARQVLAELTGLLRSLPAAAPAPRSPGLEPAPPRIVVPEIVTGTDVTGKVESLLTLRRQREEAEKIAAERRARAAREQQDRDDRAKAERAAREAREAAEAAAAAAEVARRAAARKEAIEGALARARAQAEPHARRDWGKVVEFLKEVSGGGATWEGTRRAEGLEALEAWLSAWSGLPPVEVEGEPHTVELPLAAEARQVAAFLRGESVGGFPADPAPGALADLGGDWLAFGERSEEIEVEEAYTETVVLRRFLGIPTATRAEPRTRLVRRAVRVPDLRVLPYLDLRLRWCPPGRFLMGSPAGEEGRGSDEGPQHEVRLLHGFWIGETQITQGQYEALMGKNPARFTGGPRRPVKYVDWAEAVAFCAALSRRFGARARLPREAEWEYACRAGSTGPRYGALDEIAWYSGNSGGTTHPVGKKAPNAWGLCDMLGNVWEWCADAKETYTAAAVTVDPAADPADPGAADRAVRGGSYRDGPRWCRSAFRGGWHPSLRNDFLGFRVLVPAAPSRR